MYFCHRVTVGVDQGYRPTCPIFACLCQYVCMSQSMCSLGSVERLNSSSSSSSSRVSEREAESVETALSTGFTLLLRCS